MNGTTRAVFGRVSVALDEAEGVVVLASAFDGSTDVDQRCWDKAVTWLAGLGFDVEEDPFLLTSDDVEIYRCRSQPHIVFTEPSVGSAARA